MIIVFQIIVKNLLFRLRRLVRAVTLAFNDELSLRVENSEEYLWGGEVGSYYYIPKYLSNGERGYDYCILYPSDFEGKNIGDI